MQRSLGAPIQAHHVGSLVWVPERNAVDAQGQKKAAGWVKGRVVAEKKNKAGETLLDVQTDAGIQTLTPAECPLQNERDDTVDDLVKSDFLHEPGILHTLRVRYTLDMIYTYSGNILIAANPHKRLRHLYGARMMTQYRGIPLGELSPHVYAIAEQAFNAMMIDEQKQAILISGESGAGKTESAKMVMQYLAHRTAPLQSPQKPGQKPQIKSQHSQQFQLEDMSKQAPIEEQVLESNPLLEAFGNAKTVRNDNSSRFGKFVEIDFDGAGRVSGASINTYLLERSRVVSVNAPERSYHIFYQLCAGATPTQREMYRLEGGAQGFRYLRESQSEAAPCFTLDDVDDGEGLRSTLDAMQIVGIGEAEREAVLRTVAAVLHLGNITFVGAADEGAMPKDNSAKAALVAVADLLQVEEETLLRALTSRAIETVSETIVKRLDAAAATASRDALAKNLYARLFDWLVAAINRKISALGSGQRSKRSIGILDIYGFESFKENSFEQLCINLANERLQQQFNQHVFKGEQEEYAREGIDWSYVEFIDNQDCLDVLEGSQDAPSLAVFPLIDEACRLPRATYQDLAHTLRTRLADHGRFVAPKRPQHAFAVEHYAGRVTYSSELLLEKNKDFVVAEHVGLLRSSKSQFIQELFAESDAELAEAAAIAGGKVRRGTKSAFKLNSVGAQFRKQLQGLMGTLKQCQPHFIRCIKPNPQSKPGQLAPQYVLEQLRAGGVLEAVRIACAGFPTRKLFRPFVQRYMILVANGRGAYHPIDVESMDQVQAGEYVRKILQAARVDGWQIGKTRVFLRAGQLAQLEGARGRRLTASALTIQAAFRGLMARRALRDARRAATLIAATWRGYVGRRKARQQRRDTAATRIAAAWRCYRARKGFKAHQANRRATVIQAHVRGYLTRSSFRKATELGKRQAARAALQAKRNSAAVVIQKHVRRCAACKRVEAMRREAAKWQEMEETKLFLEAQVAQVRSREQQEVARANDLAAQVARLQSQLAAAKLDVQTAREQAALAAIEAPSSRTVVEAGKVAELEAAQAAAQAALLAEMDLLRRQKAAAEEQARRLETQLGELASALRASREEVAAQVAAATAKDRENSQLWEQVRSAAEEYHAEFAAKEATIASLTAEAEAARSHMQAEIDKLRSEMEAEVAAVKAAMQKRVEEAVAETEAKASGLREAREKNVHFSARVVALNARVAQQQKEARHLAAINASLTTELEELRSLRTRPAEPAHENGNQRERDMETPTKQRLMGWRGDMQATSSAGSQLNEWAGLNPDQEALLAALQGGAIARRLPILQIQHGASASDSIGMPVAAWLLGECLLHWAVRWRPAEVDVAALRLRDSILTSAETEGLTYQGYWLSTTLALGAFLKVRSIGKRDCGNLFKLGDDMIQFGGLHALLAASVSDMLPVNVSILLSDDAKRLARATTAKMSGSGIQAYNEMAAASTKSFEGLMNSPWKGLLGGLSNVLETLRGEGAPPPACRAVVHAALRYVDAELLNALMLRRDACSVSAVKALQSGLADIRAWVSYMGAAWCGEVADAEAALEHSSQAVRYLLVGKDDCVRKATKGFDITPDLRRMCPSLTLQQIYKLTEHHHDDWITTGSQTTDILVLLQTLKRIVDNTGPSQPDSPSRQSFANGPFNSPGTSNPFATPASVTSHQSLEDEETLLLDPQAAFVLPRKLLTDAARYFVQAPRAYHSAAPGVSLLDRIEMCCRSDVQLPRHLRDHPEFAFLKAAA
ncbi:Myosin-17 [Coccomyxa sp. Obi]|nr:Myosin-17 [Coccomyxa sp. Obi]